MFVMTTYFTPLSQREKHHHLRELECPLRVPDWVLIREPSTDWPQVAAVHRSAQPKPSQERQDPSSRLRHGQRGWW
eukprot:scaffold803_cov310-Pinguiococcus_pyrenoidosus.AAC.213